ncbi:MAG: hypothetical protein IKE31_01745 [Eubacterium sp.]|nr:hypothetical protein [Eubacterium sp.]
MHNWKVSVFTCILAAGLLAGCGQAEKVDGTQTALTVNGEEISMGTAVFTLRYQQAETTGVMEQYGMDQNGLLWNQDGGTDEEGKAQTYGDLIKQTIQNSIVQQVLLRQHAGDYGVEVSPEIQEMMDATAKETYEANAETLEKIGTTEENIRESLELSSWTLLLKDAMTADVDPVVSDEEAAQSTISYARLTKNKETDGEEKLDEENPLTNAEKQALMEEFLAALQAEENPAEADFATLAKDINEEIFTNEYSFGSDNEYLATEVIAAAARLSDGEFDEEVIETEDGHYYVVRMDKVFDKEATDEQKKNILSNRKQEAYDALLQEWTDAAEITTTPAWDEVKLTDADKWTDQAAE